ncbi:MAG: FxLYD domain-containing protein [Candidatus Omnitrophica bacterium]|nr:FxLYD domain-containing protein [Candidatus Omnitrophota bacterium]MDD5042180.1 FxLYD domain-containing protein [Candidatus Omnitrophota bacterium]MDD5500209.1 FxLYD domain-containing protein [Candidatus Omnitrophota bacterium]
MPNFSYYNVEVGKTEDTKEVVISGEVINNSDKSYATVAVRIVLFKKNITVANMVFTVHGLPAGGTRNFRKTISELDYEQVGKDITRFDIYTETAF